MQIESEENYIFIKKESYILGIIVYEQELTVIFFTNNL